jgi:hypothetical protein
MIKLIFVLVVTTLLVTGILFFFKESDAKTKWSFIKSVLYLLFNASIAVLILAGIVILF